MYVRSVKDSLRLPAVYCIIREGHCAVDQLLGLGRRDIDLRAPCKSISVCYRIPGGAQTTKSRSEKQNPNLFDESYT
ncbi:hypothetical protein VTH06DRAFT_7724 [Thermothelomyces fergusii]